MLPPFGVDMYLPSFRNCERSRRESRTSTTHAHLFCLWHGVWSAFWGPFGDSFGRKPIILLGVIVGALTALVLTEIKFQLEFYRTSFCCKGFFGAAPVVLSGALLRDLFSKDQLSKVMSTITLVFMLAPLVAPIIGGYIVKFFHWHAIFTLFRLWDY